MATARTSLLRVDIERCLRACNQDDLGVAHFPGPGAVSAELLSSLQRTVDVFCAPGTERRRYWESLGTNNYQYIGLVEPIFRPAVLPYMLEMHAELKEALVTDIGKPIFKAQGAELPQDPAVSMTLLWYQERGSTLIYHSDHISALSKLGVNVIMTIRGTAKFFAAHSKDGKGEIEFDVVPGSLVFMAARRQSDSEAPLKSPLHKVIPSGEERIAINIEL